MTSKTFAKPLTALDARFEAQRIAFAPVVFQCARLAWRWGLLQRLDQRRDGLTVPELAGACEVSEYAVRVLLETCLSAGLVSLVDDRYVLEKTGAFFVHDTLTQVNTDFVHEICYRGLFDLDATLRHGRPQGLATLGTWRTIYEGLAELPEPARRAWFAFDHLYSDSAFGEVLPQVFQSAPRRVLDVGANTGRFARRCLEHDASVRLTLADLPPQLSVAQQDLDGFADRVALHPVDLLDPHSELPPGHDLVWMSQFLSCFGLDAIASIFARVRQGLAPGGQVLVLDTFWDRQQFDIAAYCVINTSPYFAALANGRSKMYQSRDYIACARGAGLALVDVRDGIGLSHSLMRFEAA